MGALIKGEEGEDSARRLFCDEGPPLLNTLAGRVPRLEFSVDRLSMARKLMLGIEEECETLFTRRVDRNDPEASLRFRLLVGSE